MQRILIGLTAALAVAALGASAATAGRSAPAKSAAAKIIHVTKGCHVWVNGGKQSATTTLSIARGGRLTVTNQDVDMHRLIELSGPAKLALPAPLAMGSHAVVSFPKPGVYRFGTKTSEMKGMPDVKTIGPDNVLRLTVVVR